eukprot:SAG11_NODE_7529_length_1134_cov_1.291787_3_plen_56_part_01
MALPALKAGRSVLQLLVENMGRINFSPPPHDEPAAKKPSTAGHPQPQRTDSLSKDN